jgi:hypothetical protein
VQVRWTIAISTIAACAPAVSGEPDAAPMWDAAPPRPDAGVISTCEEAAQARSYAGCDYWPTVIGNPVIDDYHFAVAIANVTTTPANVRIDGGALDAAVELTVAPGAAATQTLPWVSALKLCSGAVWSDCAVAEHPNGALATGGAYHLTSDVPVSVYQFNPIEYALPDAPHNSFSNDASLLFPSTAWGSAHVVAAWNDSGDQQPGTHGHPGLVAITAAAPTHVTITTTAPTTGEGGAPAFAPGVAQTIALAAGDVLELGTPTGDELVGDLTGTRIESDAPVQVIGGHYCATVPEGVNFCDHLEELAVPIEALGARYVLAAPERFQVVRVVATEADTHLTYDPPMNAPAIIQQAGGWITVPATEESFTIAADKKVLVAQYMTGSAIAAGVGDPAMTLAVPVDQFRTQYLFHAPVNYDTNHVDVVAPTGAGVTVDGAAIGNFEPIAGSAWQLAHVTLDDGPAGDGNHLATGDAPFGIAVYGYGQDTSYWYPGGLDLRPITVD